MIAGVAGKFIRGCGARAEEASRAAALRGPYSDHANFDNREGRPGLEEGNLQDVLKG